MKITVIAVGKLLGSEFVKAFDHYVSLLRWPVHVVEIATGTQSAENDAILKKIPKDAFVIALDEKGKTISSRDFAKSIDKWQTAGHSHIVFIIGGADGLTKAVKDKANFQLSFGAMTYPHLMVRVMILEQLYRAFTILNNHPYHRD